MTSAGAGPPPSTSASGTSTSPSDPERSWPALFDATTRHPERRPRSRTAAYTTAMTCSSHRALAHGYPVIARPFRCSPMPKISNRWWPRAGATRVHGLADDGLRPLPGRRRGPDDHYNYESPWLRGRHHPGLRPPAKFSADPRSGSGIDLHRRQPGTTASSAPGAASELGAEPLGTDPPSTDPFAPGVLSPNGPVADVGVMGASTSRPPGPFGVMPQLIGHLRHRRPRIVLIRHAGRRPSPNLPPRHPLPQPASTRAPPRPRITAGDASTIMSLRRPRWVVDRADLEPRLLA